jgi:hypothetical protein
MKTNSTLLVRPWWLIVILAGLLMLAPTAQGDTLFDNGPIGPPNAATLFNMTSTCCVIYDNFVLNSNTTVTGFRWSGFEEVGSAYTSTGFRVVAGADPLSGSFITAETVAASRVPNGRTIPGYPLVGYDYSITGLNLPLSAGTMYWLGLTNTVSFGAFMTSTDASPLGGGLWQDFFGGFFYHPNVEMVFAIEGITIPVHHYYCDGFKPPLANPLIPISVKKARRALPFKAELVDYDGNVITDRTISAPPIIQVIYTPGIGGTPTDISHDTVAAGLGTGGNQFVFTGERKWQFNLKLGKSESFGAPGTYRVTMAPGDAYVIMPTCEATFVIK